MALTIRDAVKHALRARIGLLAPTGGGKTFTMLTFLFAMVKLGMAKKVGVIDTEHEAASKYVNDPFPVFRVVNMADDFSPEQYIEGLQILIDDGCDAVGVDSLSHAWAGKGGSLELKDRFSRQSNFNDYTAWGPVSAMQNRLIEALLSYPGHLVATLRLKMEHVLEKDPVTGKNVVRKVGLQPVQRDGMEYEFDVVGDLDQDHNFKVSKTRCRQLDGYGVNKPGEEVIRKLRGWLESGAAVVDRAMPSPKEEHPATSVATKSADQGNGSSPTALVGATSSTPEPAASSSIDPVVAGILDEIARAATQGELDALVPRVKDMAEVPRSVVRAAWVARLNQVRAAAA